MSDDGTIEISVMATSKCGGCLTFTHRCDKEDWEEMDQADKEAELREIAEGHIDWVWQWWPDGKASS